MPEFADLTDYIRAAVQQHWTARHTPLLLSTLGLEIRKERPEYISLMPDGLQRFVEQTHIVQLVRHPDHVQKVGAVPVGVQLPADIASMFGERRTPRRSRLIKTFWDAFHTSLRARKFVVVDSDNRIHIVDADAPPPNLRSYEILPTDIVDPPPVELADKVIATWGKINAWLSRNQLPVDSFIVTRQDISVPSADRGIVQGVAQPDWAHAFSQLDPQDQARIMIPLDIVRKLLASR